MARKKRRKKPVIIKVKTNCQFCKDDKLIIDYKKYQELSPFLTDRAKIIGRNRTGVCAKHQRRLSLAVKRARHLGLLP